MTVDSPGFHAHSRWYFRREPDGSVRILAPDSLGPGASQKVVLDANTWASVVASVGAAGETGATFRAAERFHMRPGDLGGAHCDEPDCRGGHDNDFPTCHRGTPREAQP